MAYQDVKFKTEFIDREVPKDSRVKELKKWGKLFNNKDFAPSYEGGSAGNLSFRIKEGEDKFIITGSKTSLGDLEDNCFTEVDSCNFEKGIACSHGIKEPSSESMLHYAIYNKRKDINVIFHGHCQKILSCADKLKIPETKKEEPYGTIELVNRVLDILNKNNFIIMKNHGFITLGKTMKEAGNLTLQIHKKCLK